MIKAFVIFAIIACVVPAAGAAEEKIYGAYPNGIGQGTASYKKMSARLDYDAVKFRDIKNVPRILEFDTAYGRDLEEHGKLNTYGVLMVSAQCKNPEELPLASVYLKKDGKKYPLKLLFAKKVPAGSEISKKTFGETRYDAFYLLPYGYTKVKGVLCADWAKNREGFNLVRYPQAYNLRYAAGGKGLRPEKGRKIDNEALKALLAREFEFTAEEADKAASAVD